jgi:hypothetical protein
MKKITIIKKDKKNIIQQNKNGKPSSALALSQNHPFVAFYLKKPPTQKIYFSH